MESPKVVGEGQVRKAGLAVREFRDCRGKRYLLHGRWIIAWASRQISNGSKAGFASVIRVRFELDKSLSEESHSFLACF